MYCCRRKYYGANLCYYHLDLLRIPQSGTLRRRLTLAENGSEKGGNTEEQWGRQLPSGTSSLHNWLRGAGSFRSIKRSMQHVLNFVHLSPKNVQFLDYQVRSRGRKVRPLTTVLNGSSFHHACPNAWSTFISAHKQRWEEITTKRTLAHESGSLHFSVAELFSMGAVENDRKHDDLSEGDPWV